MFRWRPTSKQSASTAQWMQNDVPALWRDTQPFIMPPVEGAEVTTIDGDAAVAAWADALGADDLRLA